MTYASYLQALVESGDLSAPAVEHFCNLLQKINHHYPTLPTPIVGWGPEDNGISAVWRNETYYVSLDYIAPDLLEFYWENLALPSNWYDENNDNHLPPAWLHVLSLLQAEPS